MPTLGQRKRAFHLSFHVDAGWCRAVGDWYPDPKKFPHGLTAIAEDAHGVHWDAIEYFDPSRKRGAIYVFRGSTAHPITDRFVLKGLDPASRYRVTFQDHSSAAKVV